MARKPKVKAFVTLADGTVHKVKVRPNEHAIKMVESAVEKGLRRSNSISQSRLESALRREPISVVFPATSQDPWFFLFTPIKHVPGEKTVTGAPGKPVEEPMLGEIDVDLIKGFHCAVSPHPVEFVLDEGWVTLNA